MRLHVPNGARRGSLAGLLVIAASAFTLAVAGCATSGPSSSSGPASFHVDVGFEDVAQALEAEAFFPRSLTVNVGDSIVFTMRSHEFHTITFNSPKPVPEPILPQPDHSLIANPVVFLSSPPSMPGDPKAPVALNASFDGTGYVSSGALQKPGDSLTVTFTAPGTYEALCLLHFHSMKATIIVNAAGIARPMTDSDYRTVAAAQLRDIRAKAAEVLAGATVPAPVTNADGSRTYTVYAGVGSSADGIDYMRFVSGEQLSIKVGDSVTFDMKKNTVAVPHTITWLAGTDDPDLIIPQPQADGPPKLLVNPRVVVPAPMPPRPYDGDGYYNSGLMLADLPMTPQAFTVTYTKPGTFKYQCIFHDDDGMKGTIEVQQ
jgi:plastocyanin